VGVSSAPSCTSTGCTGTVCGHLHFATDEWDISQQYIDCKGVVGQYVWVYLPGLARSLTFNVRVFRAEPDVPVNLQNATRVCYGLEAHPQTATNPEYTIVTDPMDPIFHSTCFDREPNIVWLGGGPVSSAPIPQWRFHDHCIDCSVFQYNFQSFGVGELPAPWLSADGDCMNCAIEGTPPPVQNTKLNWEFTWTGWCDESINTCASNAPSCMKQLSMGGRAPGDNWAQQMMTETDCQLLVERDPECTQVAAYVRAWWDGTQYQPDGRNCWCWLNTPCCGRCTPWAGTHDGREVWTATQSAVPDPTCTTGMLSKDGLLCCNKYCVDQSGNSVCGWSTASWNCLTNPVGGGGCCENNTNLNCSVAGPPCVVV